VIVIDDGSGELRSVVEATGDSRVSYQLHPGMGPVDKARTVLDAGRGRYVGLLDHDDWLLPGYLEAVVARLEADPTLGVAFTNHYFEEAGRRRMRTCGLAGGRYERFLPELLRHWPVAQSAALMRREVWTEGEARLPLPDGTPVDATLWLRAAEAGWPFHYVDEPLMVYGVHADQVSKNEEWVRPRGVRLWRTFRFDDRECEDLRRRRLAEALVSEGAMHLKQGRAADARTDFAEARRLAPRAMGTRARALAYLADHPRMLPPVMAAWRRVR
jgi:glycosyltransferase involved in cell wall biosynthesis